jgi:hypothetical protein
MAQEFDWMLHELYPDIDQVVPPMHDVLSLPWLDEPAEIRNLQKSGGAADSTIAEIELQELTNLLAPITGTDLENAQLAKDVERFSPTEVKPGMDFVKQFIEEVLPSAEGMRQLTPQTAASVTKFLGTFSKRAAPSRRKQINDRLEARGLYKHEIRDQWNAMLVAFDSDQYLQLPDDVLLRKASSFLAEAI